LYGGSRRSARDTGRYQAFMQGMRDLGYAESTDFVLVERYSEESVQALARAQELLKARPDVIVVSGGISLQALQKLGVNLPVVVAISADPVRQGLAETLARPGKNFTGFSAALHEVVPRHVQLLKTALPSITRLAVLSNPRNREHPMLERAAADAAYEIGMRMQVVKVSAAIELDAAFADIEQLKPQALLILGESFYVQHYREIARHCLRYQIISVASGREYPEAGGFMSHGPNFREHYRGAAKLVDKILKGANPAELRFEQLTKSEFVLNRRTAKALGLELSDSLLLRADEIID
jgi:putative ABC transport system substrate-binding protein